MSDPAASSPHVRAGIPKEPRQGVGSDHRPMITDIVIDCAGMANRTAPLWDPHTVTTLQAKKGVTEEDREEMNRKFQGTMEAGEQGELDLEVRGAYMMAALQEATDGTIANKVQQQYPKWAATTEYREGWGHNLKLDAWCKRMNNACSALKRMRTMPASDRDKLGTHRHPHGDTDGQDARPMGAVGPGAREGRGRPEASRPGRRDQVSRDQRQGEKGSGESPGGKGVRF